MLRSVGVIVFNINKVLLVTDINHYYSFPKGHRNKYESDLDTLWRELYEETGLIRNNIKLLYNNNCPVYFTETINMHEYNKYYVGDLVVKPDNFEFNKQEITHVDFYNVYEAIEFKKFNQQRKNIMFYAYKTLNKISE